MLTSAWDILARSSTHLSLLSPKDTLCHASYASLARHKIITAPEQYLMHKAKKNETLALIAKKYGTSVRAIREANGLRSNLIHEQAAYRIPVSGGVRIPHTERARIPARRPPPPRREPNAAHSLLSAGH